jgi:histidine decarboxylase
VAHPTFPVAAQQRLAAFEHDLKQQYPYFIGFPAATDFDYRDVYPFFDYLLNNIGDPYETPYHANHSKEMERDVIDFWAELFRAPADNYWGYVTSGGSEGTLYALYLARARYPDAVVYYSQAAHYSVPKNADILGMQSVAVPVTERGEMDYDGLNAALAARTDKQAIVVATIGTTMTEAKDSVARIREVAAAAGVSELFIHSDAALAGAYLPLVSSAYAFDFEDGADSVSISGHKFIGCPMPCGIVIVRKDDKERIARSGKYTGTHDVTIGGSRNGHAPLLLWYAQQQWGEDGLRQRALKSQRLAAYLQGALQDTSWQAWRNDDAITVILKSPPKGILYKWQLATYDGWSHVVCMPGVTQDRIDAFLADLKTTTPA